MIPSKPFKQVCKKCGYSKIIVPESDVFPFAADWTLKCPKCKGEFERKNLNFMDQIFIPIISLKNSFKK